jgi:hypothetical protein
MWSSAVSADGLTGLAGSAGAKAGRRPVSMAGYSRATSSTVPSATIEPCCSRIARCNIAEGCRCCETQAPGC